MLFAELWRFIKWGGSYLKSRKKNGGYLGKCLQERSQELRDTYIKYVGGLGIAKNRVLLPCNLR